MNRTSEAQPPATTGEMGAGATRTLRRMTGSLAWDIGLPVAAYYGARLLGCDDYIALLAGTLTSALRVGVVAVRDRRLEPFAAFLLVTFGFGLALSFATGDARFMLAKDSATTAIAGLVFLGSCLVRRPLTYDATLRFAGAGGVAALRERWLDPVARRRWYVASVVWGAGLLLEAVLRIAVVYLLPLDTAVVASTVLQVTAFTLLIGWTVRSTKRALAAEARTPTAGS
ncbi:hypothetical protein BKA01_004241 [Pseudonocardia eucalypti]|nr:hypothetical protein [Pseudonocardia eucalypti]